jgi:hypothetical protein
MVEVVTGAARPQPRHVREIALVEKPFGKGDVEPIEPDHQDAPLCHFSSFPAAAFPAASIDPFKEQPFSCNKRILDHWRGATRQRMSSIASNSTASTARPGVPRASVIMTVFNDMRFLEAAVESVLIQDFSDFELLIVDDGARQDAIMAGLAHRDPRIRIVVNKENLGPGAAANHGNRGRTHGHPRSPRRR